MVGDHESTASESTTLLGEKRVTSKRKSLSPEDQAVALLVYSLFNVPHTHHHHPKTIPALCPEKRGKRHRHPNVWRMNQFRHWWKTSRLLVRLCGSYEWCHDIIHWTAMGLLDVTQLKGAKKALRHVKRIGRGGPNRDFLKDVHPFTRTLRLVIAIFRALEARVDNRFFEVGVAEAMAFMGNRCFRWWARHLTDGAAKYVMLPLSGQFFAPHLEQHSRPIIVLMGLLRATLPFMSSFFGSAFGRKLTFNTVRAFHYRWHPIQSIFHFHEHAGTYQDVDPDPQLYDLARQIAVAIGHGHHALDVRQNLAKDVGFDEIFGAGSGGYSVYRRTSAAGQGEEQHVILHLTPYGPSVLDEMPRYVILERRPTIDKSKALLLNGANVSKAVLTGFTYSGAFFTSQEWASLQNRFEEELASYRNACKIMGTNRSHIDATTVKSNELAFPPTDLPSLKAFIRTGQKIKKQKKADKKWNQIQNEVKKMAKLIQYHQNRGTAPKGAILYMEGLDCSGKSSTGGLIQDALEVCGYQVEMRQHNRPPTEAQKKMPWMARFERPDVDDSDDYKAMVWDRGPAGDFVYGNMNQLPVQDKIHRYAEFRAFDRACQADGILFCKMLFVCDKDTIAASLGKRLAQKKIAQELAAWLDANSAGGKSYHEGLEAITAHIDPTDFIAFNRYSENLGHFCDVARNTDDNGYDNPWFVINTSNRHAARLALLHAFENQVKKFSKQHVKIPEAGDDEEVPPVPIGIVEKREHGISIRAVIQTFFLVCLAYAYAHQSWKFGF